MQQENTEYVVFASQHSPATNFWTLRSNWQNPNNVLNPPSFLSSWEKSVALKLEMKNIFADQIVYSILQMKSCGAGCWSARLQEEDENRMLWARNIRLRVYEIKANKDFHNPVKMSI